jgi:hypothetical protein
MSNTLTKRDKEELERSKQTLIIIYKSSDPPQIDKAFHSWCQRTHNPYVGISKRRVRANIFMELPNASDLLDAEGNNQFRMLCLSYGVPEAGNTFKTPSIHDVPLELAEDFARKLVAIGLDYCRRNPPVVRGSDRERGQP